MPNDLIWWFHRRSCITMFLPTSTSGCTTTSALGRIQGVEWTATSQPRNTDFLKACHLPWERNTSQKESQGGIGAKSLRWAATSETKVRAQPRPGVPLVFSVALARPHCESKTSCPSAWNLPMLPGLTLPRSFSVRKSVSCLLHCKI